MLSHSFIYRPAAGEKRGTTLLYVPFLSNNSGAMKILVPHLFLAQIYCSISVNSVESPKSAIFIVARLSPNLIRMLSVRVRAVGVTWFYISVDDILVMQVIDRRKELFEDQRGFFLGDDLEGFSSTAGELSEGSALNELH